MWSDVRRNFCGRKKIAARCRMMVAAVLLEMLAEVRVLYSHSPQSPGAVPDDGGTREGGGINVLTGEYGYLELMTLRFDNREYLRSRSFRILEPRDSGSPCTIPYSRVLRLCYIRGIHTRMHNVSPCSLTQQGDESVSGDFAERDFTRNRPGEISYDVAVWRFIEVSHNIMITCLYTCMCVCESVCV